ncbi:M48 family metallopeptidase [Halostagnicola kamekurae]|uniref:Heat shock protein HtpX n=1 Tax=Halostagnicola kamekurae TaxID=619731 RepID=A0A1I6QDV5_9EURY|nr:M48 family metalloprotease [Halostagnicola kamekurae]SFS50656.1 heat shock protein HtpX [Halostagnicola kamekurae]
MRLTQPAGLATRAVIAVGISGIALTGSLAVVLVLVLTLTIAISASLSDFLEFAHILPPRVIWPLIWLAAAVGGVVWLARVIKQAIRNERTELFERTTPISDAPVDDRSAIQSAVGRFSRQVDIPEPAVRIDPTETPLAFTMYRPVDPLSRADHGEMPTIIISRGLIDTLSQREVSAVLAHETAHIGNDDLRLVTAALVPLIAAETLTEDIGYTSNIFEVCGHLLSFVALVGIGVFSRGREMAADRGAVAITGDPAALATALEKIDDSSPAKPVSDLREHVRSTNAINIVPTLGTESVKSGLRSTHPSLEARIEQLRSLAAD